MPLLPFHRWIRFPWLRAGVALLVGVGLRAHEFGDPRHDEAAQRVLREFQPVQVALLAPPKEERRLVAAAEAVPAIAAAFAPFAPSVRTRIEGQYLHVESSGLPAHPMMVGITAWQQQVPLPQPYTGANAWRLPLHPVPAEKPISIRDRFLRGAVALAVNGIPIFNPQNNRGEISQEIGELDQWGGHCGRADDYHYHVAPLHLQDVLGAGAPVAYALDGYPIYGLKEPDGSTPTGLDAWQGHETAVLGYHYHASLSYPYVNGGFRGVVVEREGQVDPQPRAQEVREALTQLRGARLTHFTTVAPEKSFVLRYTVNGRPGSVSYEATGPGIWRFRFTSHEGTTREETYRAGERRGGGGGKAGRKGGPAGPPRRSEATPAEPTQGGGPEELSGSGAAEPESDAASRPRFVLRSPAVGADGRLPAEFTGDGEAVSPPLEWSGVPVGTRSFAVIMDHVDPEGKAKWYWTLYNLPAEIRGLPRNVQGVGITGNNSINRRLGYAPPHSKGPGAKTYVLTVYALSAPVPIERPPAEVSRAVLLAAMEKITLGRAVLEVVYSRPEEKRDTPPPRRRKDSQ
ncbi:MAG: YHYH protein [Verrucomicrobia bacterium]|nr:YHYH protein [Verrucomicrobiota bacterium]